MGRRLLVLADQPRNLLPLTIQLALGEGGEPPREFRVCGMGTTETTKGTYLFDELAGQNVLAHAADYGNDLLIDYEHASLGDWLGYVSAPCPAAGWCTPQVREDGLWAADVRWTPKAEEMLRAKEYRYFSPVLELDEQTRRVMRVWSIALTNTPATKHMQPLVASRGGPPAPLKEETRMKSLLLLLGLAETATEAEALAAFQRLQASQAELLALAGKPTSAEALGVFSAWRAAAGQVETLTAQVAQLRQAESARELETIIASAKAAGKLPPAMEGWARELGTTNLAALRSYVEAAVPLVQAGAVAQPATGAGGVTVTLTAEEAQVAKQMGLDPKFVAAHKAAAGAA